MVNIIPNSWSDVSVSRFQELYELEEITDDDDKNDLLLSILCDTSIDEIQALDYVDYQTILDKLTFINKLPNRIPKDYIHTNGIKLYKLINLSTISLGEFIDLENLITSNHIQNLRTILSIFYRQLIKSEQPLLYPDKYEEYGDWIFHRESLFDDVRIIDVYGVIQEYLDFRKELYERYEGLFDGDGTDNNEDEPIIENESIISKAERIKEEKKQKSLKKWNFDLILYRLSKQNPLKIDETAKMPVIQAFNVLSMCKELNLEL